ncbi:MAG: tyrosine-type recombinase/integrase, partial [Chitinophagaceae bacterium]|nr:tyrosine-type recombinase/integrase [Chitinophagaceae bacterium]
MIELFLKYLQFEKRVSAHTSLAYKNDLDQFAQFLKETFDDALIESANYGMVRSWIISLVDSEIKPTSVNRKIASLKTFYKFLMRQQIIAKTPMQKIRILKTQKRLPSFVNEAEMITMLDSKEFNDTFEDWRDRLILELFYATGIRLSELINLQENRINIPDRTIKVLGKRNKERIIPLTNALIEPIKHYSRERSAFLNEKEMVSDFFFINKKGNKLTSKAVYLLVKKYLS